MHNNNDKPNRSHSQFSSQLLGIYYPGLFHSSTIFDRFSLTELRSDLNIIENITSHHESFHCVQDISSGYFCLLNEAMRLRDESVIEEMQTILKKCVGVHFPISRLVLSQKVINCREKLGQVINSYKTNNSLVDLLWGGHSQSSELTAIHIIEGAAAFYTEIQRRFLIYLYKLDSSVSSASNMYDFNSICKQVDKLPPMYRNALEYYREKLANSIQKYNDYNWCNLFLLMCDLALQVPTLDVIYRNLAICEKGNDKLNIMSRYLPGDRFIKLVDYISVRESCYFEIPDVNPNINSLFSDDISTFESRCNASQGSNKSEEIINHILKELNFESVEDICNCWISLFKEQTKIAFADQILKLRLLFMIYRRTHKYILSNYNNIRNTLLSYVYPSFCKTHWGTWVTIPDRMISNTLSLDRMRNTVTLRMFVRSISDQIVNTGIHTCPFINKTIIECPDEIEKCKGGISLNEQLYSKCIFGHYFKLLFGVTLSEISDN